MISKLSPSNSDLKHTSLTVRIIRLTGRILWYILCCFLFFVGAFFFTFYWFGFIGVAVGVLFFTFSKKEGWRRLGLIWSFTIGITTVFVKFGYVFVEYVGVGVIIGYVLSLPIVSLAKRVKKKDSKKKLVAKEQPKTIQTARLSVLSSRKRTIIKILCIIIPILLWSVILFPRLVGGTPIEGGGAGRTMEYLDRGIIAMRMANGSVYVGWRLLANDSNDIAFNLYRANQTGPPLKLNVNPLNLTTNFIDNTAPPGNEIRYWVSPFVNGSEQGSSKNSTIQNNPGDSYISIPLTGSYTFQKVGIADLDGDGSYDFVIKQPNVNIDPLGPPLGNWRPSEDTYKVEAYLSNGTFLWRRDLGWDIEQGVWYSPFLVYDLDGDNRAEVIIKTGVEGGDHRDFTGRVQRGPEYLSVWNGISGTEMARTAWPMREAQIYNWNSRNQLGIAYLDGTHPSIMVERGTYWFMKLEAFRYDGSQLVNQWRWANTQEAGFKWMGQGAHFMHSADVDSDGRDEVVLGSCVVNDNGVGLWTTGLHHADHCYIGDIDPLRPGLEIYYGIEGILDVFPESKNGMCLVDAASGDIIWGYPEITIHIHSQGLVSDIDPASPGMECYSGEADYPKRWLHAANGTLLATETTFDVGLSPKAVYWDSDPQRELLVGGQIYDYESGFTHLSGVSGSQAAWADILGDWREEIIVSVPGELRIYTTMIPALDRRVCLMQDPIYRLDVAHLSMGYSQPPTTSFYLAE